MEKRVYQKSILEIGNGLLLELADHELVKVLENISDPNTDYKKVSEKGMRFIFPNTKAAQ